MTVGKRVVVMAIVVIVMLTSCRKTSSTSSSTVRTQPSVAQTIPVRAMSKDEQSCKEFVQRFYDWYVSGEVEGECEQVTKMHFEKTDPLNSCKRASEFHSVTAMSLEQALSPKLKKLLDEADAAQAKEPDEIVGLDADPFLNGNAGVIYDYIVESAQMKDGRCYAIVNEVGIDGNREEKGKIIYDRIVPELSPLDGKWIIANIHYHYSDIYDPAKKANVSYDDDLIHELKSAEQ